MNEKSKGRFGRLANNSAALAIGRLGSKVLVFLLIRFYTYVLTNEQYGTADLITSLSNFLIPIACAGLSTGFFRFAAEAKSREEQTDVFSAGLSILLGSSLVFLAISPVLLLIPQFSHHVWLIVLYVLCANVHYLVSEFIRGRGEFRLFAWQGVLNTALNITFNLIFLLPLSMGVNGYVLAIIAADLGTSLFLIVHCRLWRYVRPRAIRATHVKDMLRYCIPLIPAALCWWITNVSDRYMVTLFCGEAANGLYAAAYKIPNLLTIACGIFADAWQYSAIDEGRAVQSASTPEDYEAKKQEFTAFFGNVFHGYAGLLFIATAALILLCRPLAYVLFDESFADAWQYIPVLVLATAASAQGNFCASAYMVEQRSIPAFLTALCGALVNVALNFALIPSFGAMGAGIATLAAYLVILIVRLATSRRSIPYSTHPVYLALNWLLLCALAAVMTSQEAHWLFLCMILIIIVLAVNIVPLWKQLKRHYLNHRKSN